MGVDACTVARSRRSSSPAGSGARFRTSTWDSKGPRAAVTPPPIDETTLPRSITRDTRVVHDVRGADLAGSVTSAMGSLIKKRRKRMRKKKHKKLLKKTRWQRRQQGR